MRCRICPRNGITDSVINDWRYNTVVIKSFADADTEEFWRTGKSQRKPPANLRRAALRKLLMIDNAAKLEDLWMLPANRLERLRGDRAGQHSIRINDQFRICFVWKQGDAHDVEITDYH